MQLELCHSRISDDPADFFRESKYQIFAHCIDERTIINANFPRDVSLVIVIEFWVYRCPAFYASLCNHVEY